MKRSKVLTLLLLALFMVSACAPHEQQVSDEDYYAAIVELEPEMVSQYLLLPLKGLGFFVDKSPGELQEMVISERETWERLAALEYDGKTFASSHRLLQDMADMKLDWIDRLEEAIPKGRDTVRPIMGELVSHAGEYEAYDTELKRNEDASDWTTDQNGEVIAKADVVEATDEELAVDERYLYLKRKAKGIDKEIRVFLDDEKENTLVLTYKEPADSRIKGDEHVELLHYFIGLIEGASYSYTKQRGDFRMEVEFN